MSSLSGYDSEVVGFDCIAQGRRPGTSSSTQTSEFSECGVSIQTNLSKEIGCSVNAEDLNAGDDILKEYPPPGLNEFLRKVVPGMMEQLDRMSTEFPSNSSDTDEDKTIRSKLFQEIKIQSDGFGAGDHHSSILGVSWSSTGTSFAVTLGQSHHDTMCDNPALIQVFILKRSRGNQFVHVMDISEKNCVTALKYHPSVAALFAYGTTSGEVVLCDLRNGKLEQGTQLVSPPGCHGSQRVSALRWADFPLARMFLGMHVKNKGTRRTTADQVLISAGSDGTLNVWQVNTNVKVLENVISYSIRGKKEPVPDLNCFDFLKNHQSGSSDSDIHDNDVLVVGTKSGDLFLCKVKDCGDDMNPVQQVLAGHSTCVLDIEFIAQKPGMFVSASIDSELRIYDIKQTAPLKIIPLDASISCMGWLPMTTCAVLGVAAADLGALKVYDVLHDREVPVEGPTGPGNVTCLAVDPSGLHRVIVGDSDGIVRVLELPWRRDSI